MTLAGLFGRKVISYGELAKIVAPIPYRALNKEEREKIWDVARKMPGRDADELIWKSTIPAANARMKEIADLGYEFSEVKSRMGDPGDYRYYVEVTPTNSRLDVGRVDIWQPGGFDHEPVRLALGYIDNVCGIFPGDMRTNCVLSFGANLKRAGIPFEDPRMTLESQLRMIEENVADETRRVALIKGILGRLD